MNIEVGRDYTWHPYHHYEPTSVVQCVGERRGGCYKLSNGWVVGSDGVAEGTARMPGRRIEQLPQTVPGSFGG